MTAAILKLETWRDPDGVLQRTVHREAHTFGWPTLGMLNSSTCKRDAVAMYARLGLHPILLHGLTESGACTCGRATCGASAGKHPVHANWQRATLAAAALDAALQCNWRFNVGLRMGHQPSGVVLVAIDVDGARELLAPLEEKNGPLPPTLTASSGKGLHLIFRMPTGLEAPKNRVRMAPGIDVRSEGGQIVAAPSTHHSGRKYRWLDAREPAELPQ